MIKVYVFIIYVSGSVDTGNAHFVLKKGLQTQNNNYYGISKNKRNMCLKT